MKVSRTLPRLAAAALAAAVLVGTAATGAQAADGTSITYVNAEKDKLELLVSVPAGTEVDLDGVTVTIDGEKADTTASLAEATATIKRTAVLAIDTSNSMRGPRFVAAKGAARTFLETVPDDVYVGIVTFDADVATALTPTQDRDAALAVIDRLDLARRTSLYDGVIRAVDVTGLQGQRSVIVLSDGGDTTDTELTDVTATISRSDVLVDVVAIAQKGKALAALQAMAAAGQGEVIDANPAALRRAFARQADALAAQVQVIATIPPTVEATEAEVAVTLPAGAQTLETSAFTRLQKQRPEIVEQVFERADEFALPGWTMYAAVGMVGVGLLALFVAVVPRGESDLTTEAVVARAAMGTNVTNKRAERDVGIAQATDAAAQMLRRNASLEGKIAARLEAAGSHVKSAEWLLLHLCIVVIAAAFGLLIGGGSLVVGLLFTVGGVVLPWMWLGFRKSRRLKAFNNSLPDTLQLMAGSLQAGLSLAQAVDTIVREGTEPVSSEFKRVLVETRLGVSLDDALDGVADRFQSKDFGWVVMAIKIQREVGGNLAELLNTVADTMRERQYMRRQVNALAAEGKLSAYVLTGLPVMFMFYLLLTKRDYVMPMFTEPLGWLMLGAASTMLAVGGFWMSRLIKVEV